MASYIWYSNKEIIYLTNKSKWSYNLDLYSKNSDAKYIMFDITDSAALQRVCLSDVSDGQNMRQKSQKIIIGICSSIVSYFTIANTTLTIWLILPNS